MDWTRGLDWLNELRMANNNNPGIIHLFTNEKHHCLRATGMAVVQKLVQKVSVCTNQLECTYDTGVTY